MQFMFASFLCESTFIEHIVYLHCEFIQPALVKRHK